MEKIVNNHIVDDGSTVQVELPWFQRNLLPRLTASGLNLGLSLLIFGLTVSVLFFLWYPAPYYRIDGLWMGLRIAVIVDLILGPLLTLAIFRRGKPGLKLDLACIGLVQIAALVFGVYTIYTQRPYFVVFSDDQFYTVRWSDVMNRDRPENELRALHDQGVTRPPLVVVPPDENPQDAVGRMVATLMGDNSAPHKLAGRYVPFDAKLWLKLSTSRLSAEKIRTFKLQEKLDGLAAELKRRPDELSVFKLSGRFEDAWMVLDKKTGALLGYLP